MRKRYYQSETDDETEFPDLDLLAKQNTFDAGEIANWGTRHFTEELPEDNAIRHQDPGERLTDSI